MGAHTLQLKLQEGEITDPVLAFYWPGKGYFLIISETEPTSASTPAPGCEWVDAANGLRYYNSGTASSPSWTIFSGMGE